MLSLKNKVILVTGSAVRLGRAISQSLFEAKILLHYHQSKDEVISLKNELTAKGCDCSTFQADFNHPHQIQSLFDHAKNRFGHLDVLINNAAHFEKKSLLTTSRLNDALRLNLTAPLLCAQLAAPLMPPGSLILNICDTSSHRPIEGYGVHSLSKKALMYSTQILAQELAPHIRVNNLLIGVALPSKDHDQATIQKLVEKHVLLKRAAKLCEITHAIRFIIENNYLNATTLELDGGWV